MAFRTFKDVQKLPTLHRQDRDQVPDHLHRQTAWSKLY